MAQNRPMSILPTIKCSNCSVDIQISKLGDHVCNDSGQLTPAESPTEYTKILDVRNESNPPLPKPGTLLPRVDTNIANRLYLQLGPYTPTSASPLSGSPERLPHAKPVRSATMPLVRAPPSPEPLSSNLDCAFPPFPPTKLTASKPMLRSKSEEKRNIDTTPMLAPLSPRGINSGGFMQRANSIVPGPFDVNGGRVPQSPEKSHQRTGTESSIKVISDPGKLDSGNEQLSAKSNMHTRNYSISSLKSKSSYTAYPKPPRRNGYEGFGPPKSDDESFQKPARLETRSQTLASKNEKVSSTSSDKGLKMKHNERKSSSNSSSNPISPRKISTSRGEKSRSSQKGDIASRDTAPRYPGLEPLSGRSQGSIGSQSTRGSSFSGLESSNNDYLISPSSLSTVSSTETYDVKLPTRTSSKSISSSLEKGFEEFSFNPKTVASKAPARARRKPSNTNSIDLLLADLQSSMSEPYPADLPVPLQTDAIKSPSSPRRLKPQTTRPPLPRQSTAPLFSPRISSGNPEPLPTNGSSSRPSTRDGSHSKATNRGKVSKGKCKGCSKEIYGKSISSADGRLTGRYHKQCFVCMTCQEPFKTSTFYVLADAPYCERHYHELNGSICGSCDQSIEGEYLETERKQKHHPGCLRCEDCDCNLRYDYFEMNDHVYCERHAIRRARQKQILAVGMADNDDMERRTTTLMTM